MKAVYDLVGAEGHQRGASFVRKPGARVGTGEMLFEQGAEEGCR